MTFKNRFYPHLLAEDIELWEQWLTDNKNKYKYFDYDVRVGSGRDPGPNHEPKIRQMGIMLSQRRIDAVGYAKSHIAIIEITLHAGIKAVGQLTVYPELYIQQWKPTLPIQKVLICREKSPDIDQIIEQQKIHLYQYL